MREDSDRNHEAEDVVAELKRLLYSHNFWPGDSAVLRAATEGTPRVKGFGGGDVGFLHYLLLSMDEEKCKKCLAALISLKLRRTM